MKSGQSFQLYKMPNVLHALTMQSLPIWPSLVLNTRPKQLSVLIPLDIKLNVSDVYATLRLQVNEESNLCVQSGAEINKT